jgi:hypothetical protein
MISSLLPLTAMQLLESLMALEVATTNNIAIITPCGARRRRGIVKCVILVLIIAVVLFTMGAIKMEVSLASLTSSSLSS